MPRRREKVVRFFDCLLQRRFSEAERLLEEVRRRRWGGEEFKAGYLKALEGMLLSSRSGDERDFLNRAPFTPRDLKRYGREFRRITKMGVKPPFDQGYLTAWMDFISYRLGSQRSSKR
ncbi:MAG: hypothetical protein AYL28_000710 [Candidatus Bathyarchaeota archaeon B23]|nr:MAG: hypothetical protein AYL28_000710 [Candidatus Bathyarchaeota archaeon B23]